MAFEKASKNLDKGSQKGTFARRERDALLQKLGYDRDMLMHDVEDALLGLNMLHRSDQDRVAAIIEHEDVQNWILTLESQALVIHGNCRRDEVVSPTSVAAAMLVRELFDKFSEKTSRVVILYWFCGSNIHGVSGNIIGMVRSFICQLVSRSFVFDIRSRDQISNGNLGELLDLFMNLLQQLPKDTIVVSFIDGISFYEGDQQHIETCKVIHQFSKVMKSEHIFFKMFITSPKRTISLLENPMIAKRVSVVEIPQRVDGLRQGFGRI